MVRWETVWKSNKKRGGGGGGGDNFVLTSSSGFYLVSCSIGKHCFSFRIQSNVVLCWIIIFYGIGFYRSSKYRASNII